MLDMYLGKSALLASSSQLEFLLIEKGFKYNNFVSLLDETHECTQHS